MAKENVVPPPGDSPSSTPNLATPVTMMLIHNPLDFDCYVCRKTFSSEFTMTCNTCGDVLSSRQALMEHNHSGPASSSSSIYRTVVAVQQSRASSRKRAAIGKDPLQTDAASKRPKVAAVVDLDDEEDEEDEGEEEEEEEEEEEPEQGTSSSVSASSSGQAEPSQQQSENHCDVCGTFFKDKMCLKTHRDLVHFSGERVKCPLCERTFKHKVILSQHLRVHTDRPRPVEVHSGVYRCCKCEVRVEDGAALEKHLQEHHQGTESETEKCPDCSYRAACKDLCEHLQKEHLYPSQNLTYCPTCGKGLSNGNSLRSHVRMVHLLSDGTKNFKCPKCPKMFKSANQAKHHSARVHLDDDKPSQCPHCPYLGWPLKLALHIKLNHETVSGGSNNLVTRTKFRCEQCGKVYDKAQSLKLHLRSVHGENKEDKLGFREFRCPHCDFKSLHRDAATEHISSAHRDKTKKKVVVAAQTEVCHICDKGVKKGHMRRHLMSAHTVAEDQDDESAGFKCENCGKGFAEELLLLSHMEVVHGFVEGDSDDDDD